MFFCGPLRQFYVRLVGPLRKFYVRQAPSTPRVLHARTVFYRDMVCNGYRNCACSCLLMAIDFAGCQPEKILVCGAIVRSVCVCNYVYIY